MATNFFRNQGRTSTTHNASERGQRSSHRFKKILPLVNDLVKNDCRSIKADQQKWPNALLLFVNRVFNIHCGAVDTKANGFLQKKNLKQKVIDLRNSFYGLFGYKKTVLCVAQ